MVEINSIKNEKVNDIPMIISCSTFSIPSIIYYYNCDIVGSILFFMVTWTSIMADGVYKNHSMYNKIDVYVATICYIYAGLSTLIPSFMMGYTTLGKHIIIYNMPLFFIKQSRAQVCRSESWRRWHIAWHYCVSGLLTYSLLTLL